MAHRSLIIMLFVISVSTDEVCTRSESCIGHRLNDTGSTQIQGYKAASSQMTSFSGGSITCSATYSCNSMSFIHAKSSEIVCSASNSCSNTTIISNATIECTGAHSCINSNIISSQLLKCSGSRSCENANITRVAFVYSHGMLALYKSVIDTLYSAVSVISIHLQSHLAAYGASFICRETHECHIYCGSIDACYMFYIQCIGTCYVHNSPPHYHQPIANFYTFNETDYNNITIYKPFDYDMIRFAPYTNLQCITGQWSFDDEGEQHNMDSIAVTVDNEAPICCRGHASCQNVAVIEYRTQIKKDLICSAASACSGSMIQNINEKVYCHGRKSCFETAIHYVNNIQCGGYSSCGNAVITGATNIICHGVLGCYTTTVISGDVDVNIYAFGYRGAASLKLHCNDTAHCILHCIGFKSCGNAVLFCNDNCIVHCDGDYCPTVFNSSTTTAFIPKYNSSSAPLLNRSVTISTPFFYTSFYDKQPPAKSTDNLLAITLVSVCCACAVIIVAAYFVRRHYLKKKHEKAEKMAAIMAKQGKDIVPNMKTHVVRHSTKSIDKMVMEEDDDEKHATESSDTDSLYVKNDDFEQGETRATAQCTEEMQNEGEGVEQEGVPDPAQMNSNEPGFGDGIVMKHEDYSDDDDSDNIYADNVAPEKEDVSHMDDNEGAITTTTTLRSEDADAQSRTENGW